MIELYKDVDALGINNDTKKKMSEVISGGTNVTHANKSSLLLYHEIHSAPSKFVWAAFSQLVSPQGCVTVKQLLLR